MQKNDKLRIIVSLTSYPKRIDNVDQVIKTLLIQTRKPDKIILWLSEEEFPQKSLPERLPSLCTYGLEIRWVPGDLKSHKKYFYALQEFPQDVVITVDDDMYYHPELIETLYDSFLQHPKAVSCTRANRICGDNGNIFPYEKWEKNYAAAENIEVMDLLPVGAGGILYPPGCFDLERLCDIESIKKYCLYQDDIWLKVNELLSGISTVLVKNSLKTGLILPVEEMQECALFNGINVRGNDIALNSLEGYLVKFDVTMYEMIYSKKNTIANRLKYQKDLANKLFNTIISDKCIYLYGAGDGAKSVFACLKALGLEDFIKGFLVTRIQENPDLFFGLPVISLDKFSDWGKLILVTTAESKQEEIITNLKNRKCRKIAAVTDTVIGQYNNLTQKNQKLYKSFLEVCNVISI